MRNATDINILLDKSGSMQRNIEEVISGFNGYLAEQQQVFGDARLSLYQFNNRLNLTYSQMPLVYLHLGLDPYFRG